ncbi:ParB/RepB/Spo0J family partition protein [Phenylobacterium terrae]|uniref:ParB/RepB/Spo0J family partition protein n=1 Tax=Phenylobacterium terrae TaxID=2665495 RepID=A0ABW4MZ83_9CAUL
MAENRRGLGRGLSALLGEEDVRPAEAPPPPAPPGATVREVPIEFLERNPDQPRWVFPEEQLAELAASIRDKGILQPILVRPKGEGRYEIVAGERRWRAAQRAGLSAVPVLVRELTDMQVLEIGVIENVQRADLSPIEEATAYKQLMDRFGRTQDSVAEAVGKSRSHVANTLRLLSLPEGVRNHLLEGRISAGHARAIATAPNAEALAEEIIAKGLSVREAEALGRSAPGKPPKAAGKGRRRSKDVDTMALENDLADVLGLEVSIDDRGGTGALTIRYETLEQLDDLCRRLTRAG